MSDSREEPYFNTAHPPLALLCDNLQYPHTLLQEMSPTHVVSDICTVVDAAEEVDGETIIVAFDSSMKAILHNSSLAIYHVSAVLYLHY